MRKLGALVTAATAASAAGPMGVSPVSPQPETAAAAPSASADAIARRGVTERQRWPKSSRIRIDLLLTLVECAGRSARPDYGLGLPGARDIEVALVRPVGPPVAE